ncbi:reverse transcriptase [Gossypium australe]|uniref:Reverse transcriptase n=1 Tax=Gossypium australe TaxID=47621 RepID=A0A5B6WIV9_9ROSI|nr:reverse transcriptase [Gossypium australe]
MNTIKCLEYRDGRMTGDVVEMVKIARDFFEHLFESKWEGREVVHIFSWVERSITNDANMMLTEKYTKKEVVRSLKDMGPTKVPGIDGFSALVFQRYWHIVGREVTLYCLEVLNEDSAFVPGRLISNKVLLAYEILDTFCQKRRGRMGLMALKLDMSKAYDRDDIVARFWWQKTHGKRGLHWCDWGKLCDLKENGGLAQVLKAKYYLQSDFMQANLKHGASYTWTSIWSARKVLQDEMCWRVGRGDKVLIFKQAWLLGLINYKLSSAIWNLDVSTVVDLINSTSREWKRDIIISTFTDVDAARILRIPLVANPQEDMMV